MDGRLRLGPDGRLLLLRPLLPGEPARLRRLAGLPVPELVDEGDGEVLVTWAPPLAVPLAEAAPFLAGVLADAHDRGEVHGPLEVDHVRTGLLDGWAGGEPTDDVAAFGRLLLDADPPPALAALARRCVAADPATRPTMRAVASALALPAGAGRRRRFGRVQATPTELPVDRGVPPDRVAAAAPPEPEPGPSGAPPARRRREVPAWVPAAVAVPISVAAMVVAAGGAAPAPPPAVPAVTTTSVTPPTTADATPYEGVAPAEPYEGVSPP